MRQQKNTQKKTQQKLQDFLSFFRDFYTLPEYNFLIDMLLGIIISKSVICTRIAGALQERICAKKIVERFTRHLNKEVLGRNLSLLLIYKQCQFFKNDTPIIVDESDIVKKEGKKMEG